MKAHKWHYQRQDLAKKYLKDLELGAQSLAIFAERRKGKTEFCLYDLMPYALEQGYLCVYVNFWQDKANPSLCIVNGIVDALGGSVGAHFKGWKKELSLKLGILQAKISQDSRVTPSTANEAFRYLLKANGAILLVCDEIQHLATNPAFDGFTATLRTFIDSNKDRVRVVFTGSSQDNLNRLFKRQKAAFYNSASLALFPDMGDGFIVFLSKLFYSLTKRKLPVEQIMPAFIDSHYSPAFIVELLQVMVRDGFYDIESGLAHYSLLNPPNQEHKMIWEELSAIDKEVLKILAGEYEVQLYSNETYVLIGAIIGVPVKKGTMQAALKRLREGGILLNAGHGQWEFENSAFRGYVATKAEQ